MDWDELFLELFIEGLDERSNDEINQKIDIISQKIDYLTQNVDELIIRDLRSANQQLANCLMAHDYIQLAKLEHFYIQNIGLTPEFSTGGIPNQRIIALSYWGLIRIHIALNKRKELLYIYILRMFATGERFVRTTCFPKIYESLFKTSCSSIIASYDLRIYNILHTYNHNNTALLTIGQGTLIVVSNLIPQLKGPCAAGVRVLEGAKSQSSIDYEAAERLEKEREIAIDNECAKIAKNYLKEMGHETNR